MKMNLRMVLKLVNPLIWCWNVFKYFAHLETYRGKNYDPYNFDSRDTPYF